MTMQTITRRAALVATLTAAGAALVACETTKATSTGDMTPADVDFVTNAYNIIEFDRQECTIAQTQARTPEVRELAGQLLMQANEFDAQLRPIAASAGITPPSVLRTDLRTRSARLRLGQGLEFDKAFVEDQIVSHQDALNMQQSMMESTGANPKIRELSSKGTAILTRNLARLRELQRKMIMMPG